MLRKTIFSILLSVLLGHSSTLLAAPNLLLQCLAKEEESLHKKPVQNALFRLNQEFVNELAGSNDINLKKRLRRSNLSFENLHAFGSSPALITNQRA